MPIMQGKPKRIGENHKRWEGGGGKECEYKKALKLLRNENKGGVKVVSIDRSHFKELSLIFITSI